MEDELGVKIVNKVKHYTKTGSRSFVRYADDFVVICYTKADAELVIQQLDYILSKRGLTLSKEKTTIKNITNGFNFLGFKIKRWPMYNFNPNDVFIKYNDHTNIVYD